MASKSNKSDEGSARLTLPGFVNDSDVGLGDAIARFTTYIGVAPCDSCKSRAAQLNRWLAFRAPASNRNSTPGDRR